MNGVWRKTEVKIQLKLNKPENRIWNVVPSGIIPKVLESLYTWSFIHFKGWLNIEFFIVFAISFGLTLLTIDHTRVFLLLSIPMLIYISHHFSLKDFVIKISPYFPIWIILFFQFQKTAGGAIIDESSRWTWLIDFLPFKSALANLMGI